MTKRKVVQPDLIDLLLADYQKPEDLLGEHTPEWLAALVCSTQATPGAR